MKYDLVVALGRITGTAFLSALAITILLYPADSSNNNSTISATAHIESIEHALPLTPSLSKTYESGSLLSDSDLMSFDEDSRITRYELSFFRNDLKGSCTNDFGCSVNFTTGWQDNTSLRLSTTTKANNTFSWFYGKEIEVNPDERYELVTRMKSSHFAKDSRIALEAYNETLKNWKQIKLCPSAIDGPLAWRQFSCEVRIPEMISKIRPVLIAGWSSHANKQADTFFDDIYLIRLPDVDTISNLPKISDLNLKTEVVAEGLKFPTSMAFLGPDDILVLEKDRGTVRRVINGTMLPEPVLDVNVGSGGTRGMLGIAIDAKNESENRPFPFSLLTPNNDVFLYFTESKDGVDEGIENTRLSNRLYRYELENNKLVSPKLLLELPATSETTRNGGIVTIGPDNNVYTVTGDLGGEQEMYSRTKAQNYRDGPDPDGRSGIIHVTQDGKVVNSTGILGDEHPLDMYYAYGIRNSFGLDFDPVTGKLWDTENGPGYGDEINLVEPGFNSGWQEAVGAQESSRTRESAVVANNLEDFGGKGKYSDPEYEWSETVGPTAVKFLDSDKLGKKYEDDMFIGDINNGNIYYFELNNERTKLLLDSALEGRINENIVFAKGFGGITDIEVGPDGYLYVVSFGKGAIFRIVPTDTNWLNATNFFWPRP